MRTDEVRTERLTPENLPEAVALWPDRARYTRNEFACAVESASTLLHQRRAIGALLRRGSRALAVGLSAFIPRPFIDRYLEQPHPHLGKRILLEASTARSPVLTVKEIALGNATDGLDLAVLMTHIDPAITDQRWELLGSLMQAFIQAHAGYRLRLVLNEVFGDANADDVRTAGAFTIAADFPAAPDTPGLTSLLATLSRDEAVRRRSMLLPMFIYREPHLGFTLTEQELLVAALEGHTDEALASQLNISLSGVKARWTRIQDKALTRLPAQFAQHDHQRRGSARGAQTRHILLRYLRHNPSELTPFSKPGEHRRASSRRREIAAAADESDT